jgi:hypothetical protein
MFYLEEYSEIDLAPLQPHWNTAQVQISAAARVS